MRLSTAYHTWFKEKRAGTISKKAKLINVPFKGTLMPTKQWYIKPSTLFLINPSQQGQPSHCRGRAHTSWCAARCSWKSRRRSSLSPPGPWGDDVGGDLIDFDDDWLRYLSKGVSNCHPKLDQSLPRPAPSLLDWDALMKIKNNKQAMRIPCDKIPNKWRNKKETCWKDALHLNGLPDASERHQAILVLKA